MTIMRRGGSFGVKVWDAGLKKHRWVGSFSSREEAVQAEADATLKPSFLTPSVAQWGRVWLSDYAREAPSTRKIYRQAVKVIVESLGETRMGNVDRRRARELAQEWPRNTSAIARTMWADAVRDGIARENPWTNMRLKQSRGRKDIVALTEAEVAELADTAERAHGDYGQEARAIILTLAYVGVRPGELAALTWENLDPHNQEMWVRRAVDGAGGVKLPKNGRERLVVAPEPALGAVLSLPKSLADPWIFHTPRGVQLSKSNLGYIWRKVATAWEATGHRHMDCYELRHTCASILLERGLSPSDVAQQLGHTDGGILVSRLYGHPDAALARDRVKMALAGHAVRRDERERRTA